MYIAVAFSFRGVNMGSAKEAMADIENMRGLAETICIDSGVLKTCGRHEYILLTTGEDVQLARNRLMSMLRDGDSRLKGMDTAALREAISQIADEYGSRCSHRDHYKD
jgi:hypothetical protein